MWAGGRLQFHAPLRVGQSLRRTYEVTDVRMKTGRSGTLVFVTVRHVIHRCRRTSPVLTEEHDIVYRPMDAAHASTPAPEAASATATAPPRMRHTVVPDPVLLFRYSALTANGHRIHYDREYARDVEGYPGLVVHGPLVVTLLLQLLRRESGQPHLRALEYRALDPAFEPGLLHLNSAPGVTPDVVDLWATERGVADPNRLAVSGWSYGGILTNAVIARDTRFKAAVSGAGASNMYALYGHDMYIREYELELGTPWPNREAYDTASYPFLHANQIKTPTLFLCAEKDFNVPCLGGEQMYQALRSQNIPTRLVIYSGENHGLSVPSYLRDRMQRHLDWYAEYLH